MPSLYWDRSVLIVIDYTDFLTPDPDFDKLFQAVSMRKWCLEVINIVRRVTHYDSILAYCCVRRLPLYSKIPVATKVYPSMITQQVVFWSTMTGATAEMARALLS